MRYKLLSRDEFVRAANRGNARIIDLRDPEDYRQWHVRGAENMPYEEISEWSLSLDPHVPVLLYCAHGNESILAARDLGSRGFQVASLIGGVSRR